jgi:hypothetical protein
MFGDLFPPTTIKAVSLWQPWASLVAFGIKFHETRHWTTNYRGPLAICAARVVDTVGAPEELCQRVLGRDWVNTVPTGAVVAIVNLTGVKPADQVETTQDDRMAGNFSAGRFAWVLEDVQRLDQPIPIVGRQGLFNWTVPEVLKVGASKPQLERVAS